MDGLKQIEEINTRLERDLVEFDDVLRRAKEGCGGVQFGGNLIRGKLDESLHLITVASSLLTSLISLKVRLRRLVDDGAFTLRGSQRSLSTEITDVIQSVRTTLSSLTERNRTLRDLFSADEAKARHEGKKLDAEG